MLTAPTEVTDRTLVVFVLLYGGIVYGFSSYRILRVLR